MLLRRHGSDRMGQFACGCVVVVAPCCLALHADAHTGVHNTCCTPRTISMEALQACARTALRGAACQVLKRLNPEP